MKQWRCSVCGKWFYKKDHVENHIRDTPTKKHAKAKAIFEIRKDDDESMADVFVNAEISRAMGEPVDDWIADMLPD